MKPHRGGAPRASSPLAPQGHAARKRFGQHFLTDQAIIGAIVRAVAPNAADALVEIGPGLGALTLPLLAAGAALTVIELDRDLAARWRARAERPSTMAPGHPRASLQVIEADVLTVDFPALAQQLGQPLRIVGNLPYNISTPILFHLTAAAQHLVDLHLMLQKEVVERMAANAGCKAYGRLSVMLQWRFDVQAVMDVPPAAFEPPPKVDSAVVWMRPRAHPAAVDEALLQALTTAAFSQRRKLLRHSLGPWLTERGYTGHFDLQRRAEEVPVSAYLALAGELSAASL